jgi:hypothetical protein
VRVKKQRFKIQGRLYAPEEISALVLRKLVEDASKFLGASCIRCWSTSPAVLPYPRGSWGPEDAETLVRGHPRWQDPWLAAGS